MVRLRMVAISGVVITTSTIAATGAASTSTTGTRAAFAHQLVGARLVGVILLCMGKGVILLCRGEGVILLCVCGGEGQRY